MQRRSESRAQGTRVGMQVRARAIQKLAQLHPQSSQQTRGLGGGAATGKGMGRGPTTGPGSPQVDTDRARLFRGISGGWVGAYEHRQYLKRYLEVIGDSCTEDQRDMHPKRGSCCCCCCCCCYRRSLAGHGPHNAQGNLVFDPTTHSTALEPLLGAQRT